VCNCVKVPREGSSLRRYGLAALIVCCSQHPRCWSEESWGTWDRSRGMMVSLDPRLPVPGIALPASLLPVGGLNESSVDPNPRTCCMLIYQLLRKGSLRKARSDEEVQGWQVPEGAKPVQKCHLFGGLPLSAPAPPCARRF
jgi:hypothetical protein